LDLAKSSATILPDIDFVSASKRRDFCSLGTAGPPLRFSVDIGFTPAKAVAFARDG